MTAALDIARAFTDARKAARALPAYPGDMPPDLASAYEIQEAAIPLWPDRIIGWKVGLIAPPLRPSLGADRLAGPIFSRGLLADQAGISVAFPQFEGGCACVEGEFVFRLGADAPAGRTDWTADSARDIADAMFIGIEAAGSPLATINDLGPPVVISDFGNNAALILGPQVAGWRDIPDQELTVETFIDGLSVGTGTGARLPNGPLGALAFLLNNLAARGRHGRAGELISTGAVSGVHDIALGQRARVSFGPLGEMLCHGVKALETQA